MTTARQIIEQAMRKINVLGRGQTLSADEAASALDTLNDLMGSWSVEGGLVYQDVHETFNLTSAISYTIGVGGDFNTIKPYEINAIYVTQVGIDYPLSRYSKEQYAAVSDKDIGAIPEFYYFDNNHPLASIFLFPAPAGVTFMTIYSRKPLTSFTSLNTDIDLPVGYKRALVNNLAVDLSPEYEKTLTDALLRVANESKGNVFAFNSRNEHNISQIDDALLPNSGFNINSGTY